MKLTILLMLVFSLSACVVHQPAQPNDPYYAPVLRTNPAPDTAINGSLYQPNVALSLFDDGKARQIGDILTVVLQERTTSSKSSNIEIIKESDVNIAPDGVGTILGTTPNILGRSLNSAITGDREFVGEADADQSNRLNGSISVTVIDVYPNGTLVIRGEKWITLNRGSEFIRISGMVRPEDVAPDNSVASTKIANARIAYSGTGELADSQQMGWVSRFFNSPIWPF